MPDSVMLSYGLWQQVFERDPNVIGKQITLDRRTATIVGVMPESFRVPSGVELWRTAHFSAGQWTADNRNEGSRYFNVFGRLKPEITLQMAQDDLTRIGDQLQHEYSATDSMWQLSLQSLRDSMFGSMRPALIVLLVASSFLLLIACVNVANLLLSRAASRSREVALRRALGASEARIRMKFLVEGGMLSLTGGLLGLLATSLLVRTIAANLPGRLGVPQTLQVN